MIKFVNNGELLREVVNPKAFTNVLDTLFNEAIRNTGGAAISTYRPAADILENENQFEIRLALPGFSKEKIALELKENKLTVSNRPDSTAEAENAVAENSENAEKNTDAKPFRFHVKEIYSGNFSRTFKLPENADKSNIGAEFRNGILSISIAKTDPKVGITVIEVK